MIIDWGLELYYSEDSPTGLRWANDKFSGRMHSKLERVRGDVAGTVCKDGYARIRVFDKLFLAHRVVWELCHGRIPDGFEIDHINGVRNFNSVANLRLATRRVQCRNRSPKALDNSALQGVWLYKITRKGKDYLYWRVSITDHLSGETSQKDFSLQKMSSDLALQAAYLYRQKMIDNFNNDGAGYTDRHLTN